MQKSSIEVWTPFYDKVVALYLETISPSVSSAEDILNRQFNPLARVDQKWMTKVDALLQEFALLKGQYPLSNRWTKPGAQFAKLMAILGELTPDKANPIEITQARYKKYLQQALRGYVNKYGLPNSQVHRQKRADQRLQCSKPDHALFRQLLVARMNPLDPLGGIDDLDNLCRNATQAESLGQACMPFGNKFTAKNADALSGICQKRVPLRTEDRCDVVRNGMVIEQQQILTTQNLAPIYYGLQQSGDLALDFSAMSESCFYWVCQQLQNQTEHYHSNLHIVKNSAYAWRQMVFYLSQLSAAEQRAWAIKMRSHLNRQPKDFVLRFMPVWQRLADLIWGRQPSSDLIFTGWSSTPYLSKFWGVQGYLLEVLDKPCSHTIDINSSC